MPTQKLKNLALLILLVANLILLSVVVPNRTARDREADELRQSLQTLCAREQVELDPAAIPDTVTLYALELAEDPQANLQAAAALLGEQILVQDDSTRYLSQYSSQNGACSIGRSGSFQASLEGQPERGNLTRASKKVLSAMGFQIAALSEETRVRPGVYTVTATQAVLGMPVFSDGLTLTWSNSALSRLEGVFYLGAMTRVSDSACLSAADALVAFLSARNDLGWVGSAVTAMEQGYLRSETAAAAVVRLTPVWRLDTDTGSFCIDGISGQVTAMG